jgi:metal-dependent amidase/aminoacylase/carboxypeptidase family protein
VIETLVRGKTLDAFTDASIKTDRSFRAGAYALGAGYRIETMPGYLPGLPQLFPEEIIDMARELLGEDKVSASDPNKHSGGSTDVGDVQHLMPVLTFHTGGIKGGLHQIDFDVTDEEEAYIITAKLFALSAYRLLRNGAMVAKQEVENYKPRFGNKEEYIAFMNKFNCVQESD